MNSREANEEAVTRMFGRHIQSTRDSIAEHDRNIEIATQKEDKVAVTDYQQYREVMVARTVYLEDCYAVVKEWMKAQRPTSPK